MFTEQRSHVSMHHRIAEASVDPPVVKEEQTIAPPVFQKSVDQFQGESLVAPRIDECQYWHRADLAKLCGGAGVDGVLLVNNAYTCLQGEGIRELLEACGATRSATVYTVCQPGGRRAPGGMSSGRARTSWTPPQHENALQVITPQMKELHVIGVTRALASALDCLAGALVAIAALPTSILKADFNVVHRKLTKAREKNSSDRTEGEQL